ncbi:MULTISPECIES: hypothetical protein [unclassified Beijerinckia]|uniref:hypothetical protein n=1 Tax=unclassified Beijerinckia TaxID=2638183 RepID=UPI00089B91D3|nr:MULTISPECIES: hypothetical protein [unclassified Beijerinckia]MDH7796267.1 hypothetical protein [Beijerinckia sp. GAS462]SEC37727.1 hypothetical protein SAMN05443249_2550 [Beijerinckia sp. 28-YEA-48]
MQAAAVILFLAAPIIAGVSLSLEGFVVFLLLAALVAGLSTGHDDEDASNKTSSRSGPRPVEGPGLRAPPAYTVDIKLGSKLIGMQAPGYGHSFPASGKSA